MEISTEKSKIMTNSTNNISADISMHGKKLEEVTSHKYQRVTCLCKDSTCSADVRIRIASAMAAMARLNRILRCNTISFASKVKLQKPLVTSILLYGCETWTLLADSEKRMQEETSPYLLLRAQDQRLGAEQDQLPSGYTGTSSGNCQETETCMVRAYLTP